MKFRKAASFLSVTILSLILVVLVVYKIPSVKAQTATNASNSNAIVGPWYVNAVGAPFVPHVMTFHDDGTLMIDNPEAGDPHTSDSVGVGPWKIQNDGVTIKGKFDEVNADRTTNLFVNNLVVTFTITLSNNGNSFTGIANADYYTVDTNNNWIHTDGPFPATLNGTRIKFNSLP